jgi:lysophospholipase L1-like esterase
MMRRLLFILTSNAVVVVFLYLAIDFVISRSALRYQIPAAYVIDDPRFHHTLAKNVCGFNTWGKARYEECTNSLGFRDSRIIKIRSSSEKKCRVVFIGDSFTEGYGLPWEKTFVGMFANHFKDIEVLNAGVVSYSPSIYLRKLEWLLDQGVHFDHLVVYIDISDIQDEAAIYDFDSAGNVVNSRYSINMAAHVGDSPADVQNVRTAPSWLASVRAFVRSRFALTSYFYYRIIWSSKVADPGDDIIRAMWTVSEDLPGYGDMGVKGGIQKAVDNMTQLVALLRNRKIAFSVAVYPWPDQLRHDTVESRQVRIWQSWCQRNGCALFINHFPDFFAMKDRNDWRNSLYIPGDSHFSERGAQLIAERLIRQFEGYAVESTCR